MITVEPEVLDLEARADAAGIKMSLVLDHSGVPPSTWWRWRYGGVEPKVSTLRKVRHSLDLLTATPTPD